MPRKKSLSARTMTFEVSSRCESRRRFGFLWNVMASATPTMNKKNGITTSAKVMSFQGEWSMRGSTPPASSTKIMRQTVNPRKTSREATRAGRCSGSIGTELAPATGTPMPTPVGVRSSPFTERSSPFVSVVSSGSASLDASLTDLRISE
eukprot:Amastigsp_a512386_9.p3 type:complete len:150 gc:universal Amastigsp_a512386_9:472-23(-)